MPDARGTARNWEYDCFHIGKFGQALPTTMDDVTHMVTFARVVEARGFAAAAKRLGVSASVASKHVDKLERSLGARLLNRSTRKLSLTEAGANLYPHCARLAQTLDAAELAVAETSGELNGVLRVSAPPSMMALHIVPILGAFRKDNPRLELEFDLGNHVVDFSDTKFDLALRVTHQPSPELHSRPLAPLRIRTVASPSYLKRHGTPAHPDELAQHECLLFSLDPDPYNWTFHTAEGTTCTVPVTGHLRSNVMEPLRQMALHGQGIARLPSFMVGQDINCGELLALLEGWHSFEDTHIFAVWPRQRDESRKVSVFVDFLAKHFGDPPYWEQPIEPGGPA